MNPATGFAGGRRCRDVGERLDVLSLGLVFLEVVFGELDRLPHPGEELFVEPFAFSLGGAITSAVAARRAGARAGLGTLLGDDIGSKLATKHATEQGVDLSASERFDGVRLPITAVLNFDGDRSFITHMPPPPKDSSRADRWLGILERLKPSWCYLHAGADVVGVISHARGLGVRVALDVTLEEVERDSGVVVECAQLADVFLPNEEELLRLTRERSLKDAVVVAGKWCPVVVVTRGAAGAVVFREGRATEVWEGLCEVVVKDRTGAGDAFAGALLGRLARGDGLLEALAVANRAGSEAVARLGASGPLTL